MRKLLSLFLALTLLPILPVVSRAAGYEYEKPVEPALWAEPEFSTDHDFSIALVGDPQFINTGDHYTGTKKLKQLFKSVSDTAKERKLKQVFVLGDITHIGYNNDANLAHSYVDPPVTTEWEIAREAIFQMSAAGVPYSLCRGNHDDYMIDDYFNVTTYTDQFKNCGGFFSDSDAKHPTLREKHNPEGYIYWSAATGYHENTIVNSYKTAEICGNKYIFITVDYNPTLEVLNWVDRILTEYSDHLAIVATHSYLNSKGALRTTEKGDTKYPLGYTADKLWETSLKDHKNLLMVACGHVGATKPVYSTQIGTHGNTVHQLLVNPQSYDSKEDKNGTVTGGTQDTGMVLYLNFSENGKKISFDYYSTLLDKEMVGTDRTILLYEENPAEQIAGDMDKNWLLTQDDAIYLLYHANFPQNYSVLQNADLNGDGKVDQDDAIYLLFHIYFPERYPLDP